jgi:hypothetical protein
MSTQPPPEHRVAGKLAQLLSEVLIAHAPETAGIHAAVKTAAVNDWLEGLEAHTARFIGPFLQNVLDNSNPPPEVEALLREAIDPSAQFSTSLMQIFLWGIVSSIIGAAVQPFLQGISNELNTAAVAAKILKPVDPATIATAVGRGLELGATPTVSVPQWAYDQAAELGIGTDQVDLMASIIGLPPAMQELFEMLRRGIITEDLVETGLREGDFRDDWIQYAVQLAHAWLTPGDFVRAAVQSQMSYADAQTWAYKTGLDTTTSLPLDSGDSEVTPDMFGLAFATAGRPPGPEELGRMALRSIIPWSGVGAGVLSFEQGIAESDVKTKWTAALQALTAYVPPPRQVGTLLEHGAITVDQAQTYWEEGGVPAPLAAGYVYMTEQEHIGQDKLLAKGEITTGYFDGIFTNAQATELLGLLGFRDQVAADILSLVDFRREIQAVNKVISRVGTLYQSFKIGATHALNALETVCVSSEQATSLLATWETLRIAPVRVPTTTEIAGAVKYQTITQAEGLAELAALGYEPRDAAIVLSAGAEEQVTPLPAAGDTTTG